MHHPERILLLVLTVFLIHPGLLSAASARKPEAAAATGFAAYHKEIEPLLNKYCYSCHGNGKTKGDLALDGFKDEASLAADPLVWEKVLRQLRSREMPPENKPQPTLPERERIMAWIDAQIFKADCENPDPGRVTIRRLNRTEYNNTIRDLTGVNFHPADDFPSDDVGYGFDNIGDVLSLPPILLEKYMTAADKILDAAIVVTDPTVRITRKIEAEGFESSAIGGLTGDGNFRLGREGEAHAKLRFPAEGDYIIRVKAYGEQAGPEVVRMSVVIDKTELKCFEVPVEIGNPAEYEVRTRVTAGEHRVAVGYLNNYNKPEEKDPRKRDRNLVIHHVEVDGPIDAKPVQLPETHRRIFTRTPGKGNQAAVAREILRNFARKAFRRPVSREEVERLVKLYEMGRKQGDGFEASVRIGLQAVLVSPHFLFRGEIQPEPDNPSRVHPINEFALASRLSYFLWSTMPDEELMALAEKGRLRKNLAGQIKRMIADPRSRSLVDNFAGQWLQIRNLRVASPDPEIFPEYDEKLAEDMRQETELFFEHILREDRSVFDLIDADYTFVTPRLARHYGLPDVSGQGFQKVSLKGTARGGLLTQGSILTITSNPTRTSPVKRGKWILENILGTPPPPPPPAVPELSEASDKVLSGTLRQRMEQHREDPNCAACHARMDPIGFGFENFDAIGAWRKKDGSFEIDPAGKLVSGETFQGPSDLKKVLMEQKRSDFLRCISEKMLTYALGRGVEHYDRCATDQIMASMKQGDYRFSSLIEAVAQSVPFQMRRGEGGTSTTAAAAAVPK